MSLSTVRTDEDKGVVPIGGHCPQLTFNETTVRAMMIQLVIWVKKDFGIVLGCGDEKRADFENKLDACVDKIDGLLVEFWLLFIILKLIQ